MSAMKPGNLCMSILALLLECALVFGTTPTAPGSAPEVSASDRPRFRTYLLESAGSLGVGTGCAALALPVTLAYYLFSPGDVATVVEAEGLCLGIGCAAGACWTGRGLDSPTKFWPALGLAFLPEIGAGLVMVLTRKGVDLTDPLVAGCAWAAVITSPILATVGANLGRRGAANVTGSSFRLAPELRVCSGNPHPSAGLGLGCRSRPEHCTPGRQRTARRPLRPIALRRASDEQRTPWLSTPPGTHPLSSRAGPG